MLPDIISSQKELLHCSQLLWKDAFYYANGYDRR